MLDHISIGVRDLQAAKRFYDAALKPLGYVCLYPRDTMLGYGPEGGSAPFWVNVAAHPVPADLESGLHISFKAPSRASVDTFHADALAAGGTDHGAPGVRPEYSANYYAAFIIDPDGYRIEAHFAG